MKRNLCRALALALFACASLVLLMPAHAQSVYGSIFGTISDKTGAAIPGATVSIKDEAKGTIVAVTSNQAGDYTVPHLIPDVYDLKVTMKGYKTFSTVGIQVEADTAPRIDPTLEVGEVETTVEVNAESQPELKTESTDVSTVFNQQQVSSLPVGDQNFTNQIEKEKIEQRIREIQAELKGKRLALPSAAAEKKVGVKRVLSPAARKRIAAAQKKRWAEHRKRAAQEKQE